MKYPATRLLIRKAYWKKKDSKTPSHQIIDPQGLLKKKQILKYPAPDFWSASGTEKKTNTNTQLPEYWTARVTENKSF